MTARRCLLLASMTGALVSIALAPCEAEAQDASLSFTYRAIFHGYRLRLYRDQALGGPKIDSFRNVDPLYMTLDLGGHGLGERGNFETIASIRYRTDFGTGFHRDTPQSVMDPPRTDAQNEFDVLLLYVDWNALADRFDLRFGRQVLLDDLDWFPFDGLRVRYHALDRADTSVTLEAYLGMPVRLDLLLSSDALIADGYEINDGVGLVFGGGAQLRLFRDLQVTAAYRQEILFRKDDIEVFLPEGDPETEAVRAVSGGKFGLQDMLLGGGVGYTIRPIDLDLYASGIWNLVFGQADLMRAGLGYNPAPFLHLGAEVMRSRPRFGADSIFNVFNIFPNSRARAEADVEIIPGLHVQAGYLALFVESALDSEGSEISHGPSGGVSYRSVELGIGGGISAEVATNTQGRYAFGGNYHLLEAFADATFLDGRLGASLRGGTLRIQNDWFEGADLGRVADADQSYTVDVGARAELLAWLRARANVIKNFGSYLEGSFRVLTMLEIHD